MFSLEIYFREDIHVSYYSLDMQFHINVFFNIFYNTNLRRTYNLYAEKKLKRILLTNKTAIIRNQCSIKINPDIARAFYMTTSSHDTSAQTDSVGAEGPEGYLKLHHGMATLSDILTNWLSTSITENTFDRFNIL